MLVYTERLQGPVGFCRGIGAAMARNGAWNGIYFGSIRFINEALPKATSKSEQLRNNFIAGTIGGILGTTGNTPFDVVCSRLRNWVPGEPRKYTCVEGLWIAWQLCELSVLIKH